MARGIPSYENGISELRNEHIEQQDLQSTYKACTRNSSKIIHISQKKGNSIKWNEIMM